MFNNGTDTFFDALLSTSISFFVLLILTRLLGRKQMSQLTFFNYITGITIGSIAANIVSLEGRDFSNELSTLIWWCILTYLVDIFVLKVPKARVMLDGEPTVLIKKGKIQYDKLKKVRLDIDNMISLIRERDVFSVKDIDYAVFEPNGEITILKKPDKQKPTNVDLKVETQPQLFIPTQIIVNGVIVKKNLTELNLSYDWLYEQMHNNNVDKVAEILYAELQSDGSLYIDKKVI